MGNINEEKDSNNLATDELQEIDILQEDSSDEVQSKGMDPHRKNAIVGLVCGIIWLGVCLHSVLVTPDPVDTTVTENTFIEETVEATIEQEPMDEFIDETVIQETVEETEPEIEAPVVEVHVNKPKTDVELLACVIYQEAGADYICDDCRRRVADVVMNRVEDSRYPDTIYEVLTQYQQYGRFYWTDVVWPARASTVPEKHAVERAFRIAEEVLNGQHSELYGKSYIAQAEFKYGTDIVYCCGIYYGRG